MNFDDKITMKVYDDDVEKLELRESNSGFWIESIALKQVDIKKVNGELVLEWKGNLKMMIWEFCNWV